MKKALGLMSVLCLLAATSLLLPACVAKEGQLPAFEVGDEWVWSHTTPEGMTQTFAQEVTGEETVEGRDCYVMEMLVDGSSMKNWVDKATYIYSLKVESSGTSNGTTLTHTITYSYNPLISLFPLEIGKEIETEQTIIHYFDGSQTGDPLITAMKYTVVSKEDVTVVAGTFSCWKMIIYEGNVTQNIWWSDKAKTMVKSMDADGNTVMELQSYSVSQ
jgi:hypothetical protein